MLDRYSMMIKTKAFTLIELLVVVAIIGILAAVGVVAYNGYTSSAKKNATKANHKIIIKFMQAETRKCELDSTLGILNLNGTNSFDEPRAICDLSCHLVNASVVAPPA